jgi:hypothetical protein
MGLFEKVVATMVWACGFAVFGGAVGMALVVLFDGAGYFDTWQESLGAGIMTPFVGMCTGAVLGVVNAVRLGFFRSDIET